jgi:hypothetical protein
MGRDGGEEAADPSLPRSEIFGLPVRVLGIERHRPGLGMPLHSKSLP